MKCDVHNFTGACGVGDGYELSFRRPQFPNPQVSLVDQLSALTASPYTVRNTSTTICSMGQTIASQHQAFNRWYKPPTLQGSGSKHRLRRAMGRFGKALGHESLGQYQPANQVDEFQIRTQAPPACLPACKCLPHTRSLCPTEQSHFKQDAGHNHTNAVPSRLATATLNPSASTRKKEQIQPAGLLSSISVSHRCRLRLSQLRLNACRL